MQWAIVVENKIMQIQAGDQAPEYAVELPSDHQLLVGEDFRSYENGQLRPNSVRVAEGLFKLPKGTKLDGENIIPMTDIEKYKEGVEDIPKGMKIEGEELIPLTSLEKVERGLWTKEEAYKSEAETVRQERNWKLKESDWAMLEDAPADKALYKTYRQALRDITKQKGFPFDVEWPLIPKE